MLVKFEQNPMVQTTQNFELYVKNRFFITIFEKELMPFLISEDISVAKKIV